jgi:magnesium-transporting ATPase (P-type)
LALWLLSALYHSIVFFYAGYFLYKDGTVFSNGQVGDLWTLSITTSTMAFLVVLNKMALETGYWTIGNHLAYWGSLLVYILLVIILSNMLSSWPSFYYVLQKVVPSANFWLVIVIVFFICLLPDILLK